MNGQTNLSKFLKKFWNWSKMIAFWGKWSNGILIFSKFHLTVQNERNEWIFSLMLKTYQDFGRSAATATVVQNENLLHLTSAGNATRTSAKYMQNLSVSTVSQIS